MSMAAMALRLGWQLVRQGDAQIRIVPEVGPDLAVARVPGGLRLAFTLPVVNEGTQKGMFVEVLCRPEYMEGITGRVDLAFRIEMLGVREDGYCPAYLLARGERRQLRVTVTATGPAAAVEALRRLPSLPLVFYYQTISRRGVRWHLAEVRVPLQPGGRRP